MASPGPLRSRLLARTNWVARTILSSALVFSSHADTGKPAPALRLSQVLQQVSADPAFRERLLQSLDDLPDAWGLLGPPQRERLRNFILDRNWSALDHFPALTVAQLCASVFAVNTAVRHKASLTKPLAPPYVEIGTFPLDRGGEVSWQPSPAELDAPASAPVKDLGYGLTRGDPPHPTLWQWHNRSLRAALLFNRLALNASLPPRRVLRVRLGNNTAESPETLVYLLMHSGYNLWIEDARYFANFGHLHFRGEDVMMPFWLNTKIPVPHSRESLLVPVSHAEEEIRMRGPEGNADVSFYFGIDGMTEFRTMDTLDQYWVGKNVAHAYRDQQALEVAHLLGQALLTYAVLQRAHPTLPFHGYYRFGVCQDVVAAIEYQLTGQTTLFPITHDPQYFRGVGEIDRLFARLPNDRGGSPSWKRVRGSLPARNLADIQLPELRKNLELVNQNQTERWPLTDFLIAVILIAVALSLFAVWGRRRRPRTA